MNQFQKCQGCNLIATILEMSEDTGFIHKHSFFFQILRPAGSGEPGEYTIILKQFIIF